MINQRVDLSGKKFGRLIVLSSAGLDTGKRARLNCQCECGKIIIADSWKVRNGHTQSCGCLQVERTSKANKTHGLSSHRLCKIWHGIRKRCYSLKAKEYKNYGGRGIIMCDEWRNSINSFFNWAFSNGYNDSLSIDRIDHDGNYTPINCQWVNKTEQQRNRRCNRYLTINGKTKCLSEWLEKTGVGFGKAWKRLNLGWRPEEAVGLVKRNNAL